MIFGLIFLVSVGYLLYTINRHTLINKQAKTNTLKDEQGRSIQSYKLRDGECLKHVKLSQVMRNKVDPVYVGKDVKCPCGGGYTTGEELIRDYIFCDLGSDYKITLETKAEMSSTFKYKKRYMQHFKAVEEMKECYGIDISSEPCTGEMICIAKGELMKDDVIYLLGSPVEKISDDPIILVDFISCEVKIGLCIGVMIFSALLNYITL